MVKRKVSWLLRSHPIPEAAEGRYPGYLQLWRERYSVKIRLYQQLRGKVLKIPTAVMIKASGLLASQALPEAVEGRYPGYLQLRKKRYPG